MRKFNLDWQKGYEEGLKVGIENENNRIIKLLEDSCTCIEECYCTFIKAIALIKGEQK